MGKLVFRPEDFELDFRERMYQSDWEMMAILSQRYFEDWLKKNAIDDPTGTFAGKIICIQPEICDHSIEKIDHIDYSIWQCVCGAKVRPKEFEVLE